MRTKTQSGAPTISATESPTWLIALRAASSKKATGLRLLDLREVTSFADYFLICSGANPRQNQAIWDEICSAMKQQAGEAAISVEGYENAEWILGDYGDLSTELDFALEICEAVTDIWQPTAADKIIHTASSQSLTTGQ